MARGKGKGVRRRPQRTCVGCRQTEAKRGMIRIVRSQDAIEIDASGKAAGRGAYLHEQRSCWESALKGALERALRAELTPEARQQLVAYMNEHIPDEQHG